MVATSCFLRRFGGLKSQTWPRQAAEHHSEKPRCVLSPGLLLFCPLSKQSQPWASTRSIWTAVRCRLTGSGSLSRISPSSSLPGLDDMKVSSDVLRDSGRIGRADWDFKASNDDKREFIESCLSPSKKRPEAAHRSFVELGAAKPIGRTSLGSNLLDRLVCFARQASIHLT